MKKNLLKREHMKNTFYADKCKFVIGAYKRKLAEQAKWLQEERLCELREERDDSKYIQTLMEKAKVREREREVVYEKKNLLKREHRNITCMQIKTSLLQVLIKENLPSRLSGYKKNAFRELREERDDVIKKTDFYFSLSKNIAFGGGESQINKTGKRTEEEKLQSPEKVGASEKRNEEAKVQLLEKAGSSNNEDGSNFSPMDKDDSDASPASFAEKKSKEEDAQPVSDVPKSIEGVNGTPGSEQPKPNHHKKNEDALAAAKERFLVRKKAKIQVDLCFTMVGAILKRC